MKPFATINNSVIDVLFLKNCFLKKNSRCLPTHIPIHILCIGEEEYEYILIEVYFGLSRTDHLFFFSLRWIFLNYWNVPIPHNYGCVLLRVFLVIQPSWKLVASVNGLRSWIRTPIPAKDSPFLKKFPISTPSQREIKCLVFCFVFFFQFPDQSGIDPELIINVIFSNNY